MAKYYHGIRVTENPTKIAAPIKGTSGLQIIFGTAPINQAADPSSTVNKLIYCETFEEAQAALGYSTDFEHYTLCQSMYASFKLYGVAPVIFCNVLDPEKHNTALAEQTVTIENKQATVKVVGIIVDDTLVVKADATTLTKNSDYIVTFDSEGYLVITLLGTAGATATSLKVSGKKLDPTAVTAADIVGSIDVDTGVESGLECLRQVYPRFGAAPGLILAPGFSKNPTVAAAIQAKTTEINGKFSCECIVDISTANAKKYSDVKAEKETLGASSKHCIALWPCVMVDGFVFSYSSVYGACVAYTDATNDDVPNLSPSNKLLGIDGACLEDGTEVYLDEDQANTLNAIGVVTIVNANGIRSWGNNTAIYPMVTDPKDRWIACRRFFSWWGNTFIIAYSEKVDNPANYKLIESVVDAENIRGNSYVADDKCAGCKIEFDINKNPISQILDGKILFNQKLAPYTPAEYILNELEFDPTMIITALGGEA